MNGKTKAITQLLFNNSYCSMASDGLISHKTWLKREYVSSAEAAREILAISVTVKGGNTQTKVWGKFSGNSEGCGRG